MDKPAVFDFMRTSTSCGLRCQPEKHSIDNRTLIDVQQIIPLPEAQEYQIKIREKLRKERESQTSSKIDTTKFDVQIEGETYLQMSKRGAILLVCRCLCQQHGIDPVELSNLINWRTIWYSVESAATAEEFKELAFKKSKTTGPIFDPIRWFCNDDDELCQFSGKTYALSNPWGGNDCLKAMKSLKDKYPNLKIDFVEEQSSISA